MRSGSAIGLLAVACLGLALAGCDSTQDQSRRAKLQATRELASRHPVEVLHPNPDVAVLQVRLVGGAGAGKKHAPRRFAVAVTVRNRSGRALSDLPVSVGVRTRRGVALLNRRAEQPYWHTHLPALAPHGTLTWVLVPHAPVPPGRPFARVGAPASPPLTPVPQIPDVSASAAGLAGGAVRVAVSNDSSVPQYGLQVYALALRHGRPTAAGSVGIKHLGTGSRTTVRVPLAGRAAGAALVVNAVPTIFE